MSIGALDIRFLHASFDQPNDSSAENEKIADVAVA